MREATTTRGRELGSILRHIREDAGYTGHDLAIRLGWSDSKVSRVETGRSDVSEVDLAIFLTFCGIAGKELYGLLHYAREVDTGYRIQPHRNELADDLLTLVFEENSAVLIQDFQSTFIPGLAQTEDYIRALLLEGGMVAPDRVDTLVEARVARQSLLKRFEPPECVFYINEQALRVPVGGPGVMHEQLLHLLFLDNRRNCVVRVIPLSAASCGLNTNAFRVMQYADHDPVIFVEMMTTSVFLENKKDIDAYRQRLGMIDRVALDEGPSRELLARLASEYDRVSEGDDGPGRAPDELAEEQLQR